MSPPRPLGHLRGPFAAWAREIETGLRNRSPRQTGTLPGSPSSSPHRRGRWSRDARWLAALACVLAIGAAGSCHKPPSAETRSYYMARTGLSDAASLGCYNAGKSGRITLFFGSPTSVAGTYGATLWGRARPDRLPDPRPHQGGRARYAFCRTNSRHRLIIGVGTSNSTIDGRSDAWVRAHGDAWSRTVESLASWANGNFPGHAQIVGAWDVEPSWSSFAKAEQWMHGYDGNAGRRLLHVNSSADGCPTGARATGRATTVGTSSGSGTWRGSTILAAHPADLHHQRQPGAPVAADRPVGDHLGRRRHVLLRTMSQHGACRQVGGCAGMDNTPHEANDQLRWWLGSDRRTAQDDVAGMTDVNWNT